MVVDVLKSIGTRIREIRKQKGLSQMKLAELAGFNYTYIGKVERGEQNISVVSLAQIADALEVGLHQFFIYSHEFESLTEKDEKIKEILTILSRQNPVIIDKTTAILKEIVRQLNK
jgi:transcriptional regulator with XRE-family HTH domain